MRKLNRKGFTLIELLAVITIMGILMLVAIPAISRTIENTRRDTFADTAKKYVDSVRTEVQSGSLKCRPGDATKDPVDIAALPAGTYYYYFDSTKNSGKDIMEQGGKSSWGNADVIGYVVLAKTISGSKEKYTYSVYMRDTNGRGIDEETSYDQVKRSAVKASGAAKIATAKENAIKASLCTLN